MADAEKSNLTTLTVDLLSAYVTNNNVQHGDLSELIKSTHAALRVIDDPEFNNSAEQEYKPAVGVRKSLGSRTHIISMIDGKPYQTLKRHLGKHGLTPQEYRERYSLPRDYPMVAPAYSESRRAIAERLGLGRKVSGTQTPDKKSPAGKSKDMPKVASATASASTATTSSKTTGVAASKTKAAKPAGKAKPTPPTVVAAPAKPAPKPRAARKAVGSATAAPNKVTTTAQPAPRKRAVKAAPAAKSAS